MAVGADHHPAGERVLLEHDLVDDPRARLPEPDAVLRRHCAEELVHLRVGVERVFHVDLGADAGLDEVVAVHRRRHGDPRQPRGHELEEGHLRGGVLQRDAVGAVVGVVDAALEPDGVRVLGVREQHFLGVRERTPQTTSAHRHPFRVAAVDLFDECDGRGGPGRFDHRPRLRHDSRPAFTRRAGPPPSTPGTRRRRRWRCGSPCPGAWLPPGSTCIPPSRAPPRPGRDR